MTRQLVVYTTGLCAPCEVLKRILNTEGLDFQVVDLLLDEEAAALMERHGIRNRPRILSNSAMKVRSDRSLACTYNVASIHSTTSGT